LHGIQLQVIQLQVREALPVNISPLTGVAEMVTGSGIPAVQVAVTCVAWGADSWTEGSLAVQLEFTRAAVIAGHPGLFLNRKLALNTWLLPGGAAT
jgi:hypothetical protein